MNSPTFASVVSGIAAMPSPVPTLAPKASAAVVSPASAVVTSTPGAEHEQQQQAAQRGR